MGWERNLGRLDWSANATSGQSWVRWIEVVLLNLDKKPRSINEMSLIRIWGHKKPQCWVVKSSNIKGSLDFPQLFYLCLRDKSPRYGEDSMKVEESSILLASSTFLEVLNISQLFLNKSRSQNSAIIEIKTAPWANSTCLYSNFAKILDPSVDLTHGCLRAMLSP